MRRGDAKPRRAARLKTIADPAPGACGLSPRAFPREAAYILSSRARARLLKRSAEGEQLLFQLDRHCF